MTDPVKKYFNYNEARSYGAVDECQCPWCMNSAHVCKDDDGFYVWCYHCGLGNSYRYLTREDAIAAWNAHLKKNPPMDFPAISAQKYLARGELVYSSHGYIYFKRVIKNPINGEETEWVFSLENENSDPQPVCLLAKFGYGGEPDGCTYRLCKR